MVADVAADGARETARLIEQAGGQALAVACDVTSSEQIEAALAAAVERFGGLDIAFNNAGIEQPVKPAHEITDDEWDRLVAVNLRGVFVAMKHEIELMLRRGGGAIVNTSSGAGVKGFAGQAAYAATKHGLIGLDEVRRARLRRPGHPHQRHLPRDRRHRDDAPLHRRHRRGPRRGHRPGARSAAWAARRRSPPPCCGCAPTRPRSPSATPWSSTAARPPEGTERDDRTALDDRRTRPDRRRRRAHIAPRRTDGTLRRTLPIWVVRVGDDLHVRSWRGTDGRWYRVAQASGEGHVSAGGVSKDVALPAADDEVNDAVDAAFREKYGRYAGYVEPMVAPQARATTLRLVPRSEAGAGERRPPRGMVLAIILAGYLLVLIDVSILMAALPSIRADLGFSDTSLSWAQNAYTLTFGGLLLLGARAGDLLGRRRTFVLGIGVFTAASLAVGLAQSPAGMIAARAVQGIGAATLAPSTLALLSTSFPEGEQRSRAMAAYGALAGIGTAAGWAAPSWRATRRTAPFCTSARSRMLCGLPAATIRPCSRQAHSISTMSRLARGVRLAMGQL